MAKNLPIEKILKPKSKKEIDEVVKNLTDLELVKLAQIQKSVELMSYAVDKGLDSEALGEALLWATGEEEVLAIKILNTGNIDGEKLNEVVSLATSKNKVSIIEKIVKLKEFDPSYNRNQLLRYAASNGHDLLVKELINDHRVDPSDLNNAALLGAQVYEHDKIIKILMSDPRVKNNIKV